MCSRNDETGVASSTPSFPSTPVHVEFERIARADPDRIALTDAGRKLTYGQLNALADRAVLALVAQGVVPGQVVAICVRRSFGHIVGCLATLKAGCAFLSIDPADPIRRREALLADAGAVAALGSMDDATTGSAIPLIPLGTNGRLEPVGGMTRPPSDRPPPEGRVVDDDLAYLVFTSGSTGTPNGVEITHGNLRHLVSWHRRAFAITPDDRASHLAGLSFDAAIWEIWPYLTAGASIAIADDTTRTSPDLLRDWLLAERITIGFVPTALVEPMLALPWPAAADLRVVLTGGEALTAFPPPGLPFALVNNYGPCECTIVATSGVVEASADDRSAAVPSIGRPIAGVVVHILDEGRRPVKDGETGEIWIGGRGVGRGYHDRPALTAERFVPDFLTDAPATMLYRTGDMGRLLPNGDLAFRGRRDRQVKVRGVRIEPEEVASALRRHPGVAAAAVRQWDEGSSGTTLVAYVVACAQDHPPPEEELRASLTDRLPAAYLPDRIVPLPAMPLTANGKLDIAALPRPGRAAPRMRASGPETPTELRLAAIVEGVLGIDAIDADADFFLLGGHSMLATQVVVQSRDAFGVELMLHDLFRHPSVRAFARVIEERIAQEVSNLSDADVALMLAEPGP